ncbi:hypothetical protein IC582_004033 [Cucumis melo]
MLITPLILGSWLRMRYVDEMQSDELRTVGLKTLEREVLGRENGKIFLGILILVVKIFLGFGFLSMGSI